MEITELQKDLAATLEALSLYVDLNERKVFEFEKEKIELMDDFICQNKKIIYWLLFIVFTITTPIIISSKPASVGMFGICLYLKTPIKDKATMPTPDHVA